MMILLSAVVQSELRWLFLALRGQQSGAGGAAQCSAGAGVQSVVHDGCLQPPGWSPVHRPGHLLSSLLLFLSVTPRPQQIAVATTDSKKRVRVG